MEAYEARNASPIELIIAFRQAGIKNRALINRYAAKGRSIQDSRAWRRHSVLMHEILESLKAQGLPTLGESLWIEHQVLLVGRDLMTPGQKGALASARRAIRNKIGQEAERLAAQARDERERQDLVQAEYAAIVEDHTKPVSLVQEEAFEDATTAVDGAVREDRFVAYSVAWTKAFVSTYMNSLQVRRGKYSRILGQRIDERMTEVAADRGIRVHTRVADLSGTKYGFVKKLFLGPSPYGVLSPSNIVAEVSWDDGWKEYVNLFGLVLPQDLPPRPVLVFDVKASGEDGFSWQSEEDDVATAGRVLYRLMDEHPGALTVVITRQQKG